jgi:hypothetical protein
MPIIFPTTGIRAFWFDSGGGSSAVKFRLEKIGGRIMFGLWKLSQGCVYAIRVTQGQPGEAVVRILNISLERRWQ